MELKFQLEENLSKLARWLRFLGLKAELIKGPVKLSKIDPDAIFVTTSRRWEKTLKKRGINCILVPRDDWRLQLCSVLKALKFNPSLKLNLCAHCGAQLQEVGREDIKDRVPLRVYENAYDFTVCPNCGAVFWKGTHYGRMVSILEELKKECLDPEV